MEPLNVTLKIARKSGEERSFDVRLGQNLREFLLQQGESLYQGHFKRINCKGMGVCGSCRVGVKEQGEVWMRRACQIRCFQDMEIELQ